MKISKKSQYGLRALAYLTKVKTPCSLKTIAEREDIPFDYLEKIMLNLRKKKIVKAKKGITGGYFLARNPRKISTGEIVRALEGNISLVPCLNIEKKNYHCRKENKCQTRGVWKKLRNSFKSTLDSITLADLIK